MEERKMKWRLNDDGGSFERILREAEEAANGDESLKMSSLTRIIVQQLVEKQLAQKKKFDNLGFDIPKRRRGSVSENLPSRRMPSLILKINNKKITLKRCFDQTHDRGDKDDEKEIRQPRKQRKKGNKNVNQEERVVADMPESFKNRIQEENGTDLVLVMQKKITECDLRSNNNRLSIPPTKVRDDNFVNQKEKSILNTKEGIEVLMIPPSLKHIVPLTFKKWKMGDNYTYNLMKTWHDLVVDDKDNGLELGSEVQLWCFRKNNSDLCFALVKLEG
ncbi:B3 domain-containing protein [Citrus sinensis]|uniref:B3 domain-containing protein n=1 Tax=Citrus sinensis TaxID=2711 RepID=A0ACB8IJQ7_CITSI|nr:B3 domain-containing protein [Citrus sinensis]